MKVDNSLLNQYEVDIHKLIPNIIASIVEVYGEEHRASIEERLKTIVFNTYITYEDVKNKYNRGKEKNLKIANYIEQCEELREEIDLKYIQKFYTRILPYVSEEERRRMQQIFELKESKKEKKIEEFTKRIDPNQIYTNNGDWDYSILGSFQEKYDFIVYENSDIAKQIRTNRIQYFKLKGLDLGENYSSYEKSEKALKLWPDKNRLNFISEIEIECYQKRNEDQEFFLKTSNYNLCKEKLSKLGLCLEDDFSMDFMKEKVIGLSPNVIRDEKGEYQNISIIHLPILSIQDGYGDIRIIHEILHAVEVTFKQMEDSQFRFKVGWDICIKELKDNKRSVAFDMPFIDDLREYEILSENLHQKLAILVTEKLHQKGIYLIDDPKKSKTIGGSWYEQMDVITDDFFKNFQEEIVDSMILSDMNPIYKTVGEHNLRKLNDLIMKYNELLYGIGMSEFIDKKDETVNRNFFIQAAKENIEQMKSYQNRQYQIPIKTIKQIAQSQETSKKDQAYQVIVIDLQKTKQGELTLDGS